MIMQNIFKDFTVRTKLVNFPATNTVTTIVLRILRSCYLKPTDVTCSNSKIKIPETCTKSVQS